MCIIDYEVRQGLCANISKKASWMKNKIREVAISILCTASFEIELAQKGPVSQSRERKCILHIYTPARLEYKTHIIIDQKQVLSHSSELSVGARRLITGSLLAARRRYLTLC